MHSAWHLGTWHINVHWMKQDTNVQNFWDRDDTMKGTGRCITKISKEGKCEEIIIRSSIHSFISVFLWTNSMCLAVYQGLQIRGDWRQHWSWWCRSLSKGDGLVNNIKSEIILLLLHSQRKPVNFESLSLIGNSRTKSFEKVLSYKEGRSENGKVAKVKWIELNIPVGISVWRPGHGIPVPYRTDS